MSTSFVANFPRKPKNWDEVVIKFKLMENDEKASFKFCTTATGGETQKTHTLEISSNTEESELNLTWINHQGKRKEIENKLVLNRKVTYTLVFGLFDENQNQEIKVFLERTQGNQPKDMDLMVDLDQLHHVELDGAFENVKAIMFRFNDGRPANDQPMVSGCAETCAWCACCVTPKPNPRNKRT